MKECCGKHCVLYGPGDCCILTTLMRKCISNTFYISVDYQHSKISISALMVAAGRGLEEEVEQLLHLGANVFLCSANGWNSLDWAVKYEHASISEILQMHM